MNKGQFPIAMLAIVAIVMILKMPSEDVSKIAFKLIEGLEHYWLIGHILTGLTLLGWFVHSRFQRRIVSEEMQRIGKLRTDLQRRLSKMDLPSSEEKL